MPGSKDPSHRPDKAAATTPAHKLPGTGYRYRGGQRPEPRAAQSEQLRQAFEQHRQLLSVKSAGIRGMAAMLNRQLALAVADGAKAAELAAASRLSRKEVAQAAAAFDDIHAEGRPPQEHLAAIDRLGRELAAMRASKSAAEAEQLALLASVRRQCLMDDFELARLTGLRHDYIGRLTWGVGLHGAHKGAGSLPLRDTA